MKNKIIENMKQKICMKFKHYVQDNNKLQKWTRLYEIKATCYGDLLGKKAEGTYSKGTLGKELSILLPYSKQRQSTEIFSPRYGEHYL